ncbi:Peptidase propeptide and YPEB domain-containing protein [Tistlia consotensis]|uniref:Peptidase propeptide and YPEB domain-containing protein n=1 Tax=Tistlia consotensis USBA 355 TaxID=560819 RepID=A0A1Y6CMK0_9PROT|nr:PepSY domain-containing protein [Tistlia consotensis]SMF64591.1 Peptidase propeptide and YPEB domain-containing protein [Tistlia consotensis USBA 355]SNR97244.1 Peptidase propeptide and YPEB domain-containing protein [Tistlia consotensis]
MRYLLLTTAVAAMTAVGSGLLMPLPAAASVHCTAPQGEWQPEAALRQQLEGQGWQIKRIKVDEGCYEVYAHDKAGNRKEVYYDPRTLQPVGSED